MCQLYIYCVSEVLLEDVIKKKQNWVLKKSKTILDAPEKGCSAVVWNVIRVYINAVVLKKALFQYFFLICRLVKEILGFYYKSDAEVCQDSELQTWIQDIFEHGLSQECRGVFKDTLMFCSHKIRVLFYSHHSCFLIKLTGIPQNFRTVDELVKFVTMVIFTSSGQHSAVNSGQVDHCHVFLKQTNQN